MSLKNLAPHASSKLLSLRFNPFKVLLTFNAYAKYLDPCGPIKLLLKFKYRRVSFLIKFLVILLALFKIILSMKNFLTIKNKDTLRQQYDYERGPIQPRIYLH
jgi:hypothetical protein